MTKAEEIFKNMREEMPWSIIGEKQLKPYILEAMQEYGKYCAEEAYYMDSHTPFENWWSEFQRKEAETKQCNINDVSVAKRKLCPTCGSDSLITLSGTTYCMNDCCDGVKGHN